MNEVAISDAPITITTLERLLGTPTIPDRYRSVGDMLATILVGREMRLPAMTSLNELYLVGGSVGMMAKAMLALILRAGHRVNVSVSAMEATAECWRRDPESGELYSAGVFTFSIVDAEQAGLLGKDNWINYPKDMMMSKAVARAARYAFPDVIIGGYTPDDVGFEEVKPEALPEGVVIEIEETGTADDIDESITEEEAADLLGGTIIDVGDG